MLHALAGYHSWHGQARATDVKAVQSEGEGALKPSRGADVVKAAQVIVDAHEVEHTA